MVACVFPVIEPIVTVEKSRLVDLLRTHASTTVAPSIYTLS